MINSLIATARITGTIIFDIVIVISIFCIGVAALLIIISALLNFLAWVLDKIN